MTSFDQKIVNVLTGIQTTNPFKGKWISILGDSISTYEGWIPDGNLTYYPKGTLVNPFNTWWNILLSKLGARLCVNQSWGSRKVSDGLSVANSAANAVTKLHREAGKSYKSLYGITETATERQDPDIILIMLGVNDFNSNVPIGEINYGATDIKYDSTSFVNSYKAMLLDIVGRYYSNAKIYCITPSYNNIIYKFLQTNSAGHTLLEYRRAIEEVAKMFESNVIHFDRLNIYDPNIEEITVDGLHPLHEMMRMIATQCYNEMMTSNSLVETVGY